MDLITIARDIGFEEVCEINTKSLQVLEEVRNMCAIDRCKSYGKTWSCPPACGDLEHCQKRLEQYPNGILVQTVCDIEDEFDLEGIKETKIIHDKRFTTLTRQAKMFEKDCLPLAAGACTRCESCTYPNKPCRYPDKMVVSMEAYGLLVSDVCEKSGIKYYHGPKTMSFTSCILMKGLNK